MRLRKSRVFFVEFFRGIFYRTIAFVRDVVRAVEQREACVEWHDSPLCLAAPSGQPPKPAGSRRRREGLTAKARAERQSSDNGCLAGALPRQAEIRQERELVDLLFLSSSIFQSGSPSDRRDVGVAFDALDIQGSPLLNLCDTRRINLYPVGLEPKPRSLMQHCEGRKGLQGGWDPSLRWRLAATPPGGHASTLDWMYLSSVFKTPALISLSER